MDLSPDEDNFQGRLLHQAALWDNVELLQELLSSGADGDARDEHGRTALHAAALAERSRCVAALCAAGTSVDVTSDSATGGKTALHIAAERGHVENVRALLAAGAACGLRDGEGDTALQLAERGGHRHAAHALREARVRSKELCNFKHRSDFKLINYLVLTGDFRVAQAGVAGGEGPTRWLIHASGIYKPWQLAAKWLETKGQRILLLYLLELWAATDRATEVAKSWAKLI